MKKIFFGAVVIFCILPAMLQTGWAWGNKNKEERKEHRVEQKQENKEFQESLKEKTPDEKQAAIQKHRDAQLAENKAFQQAMHDKQMAELKAKLAKNTKLTEAQKSEILAAREKQSEKNMAYGNQRRSENAAFFQNLVSNPKMTEAQKREAIRAHYETQKPAHQAFRQQQKTENKAEREKIRAEASSAKIVAP